MNSMREFGGQETSRRSRIRKILDPLIEAKLDSLNVIFLVIFNVTEKL